MEIIREDAFRKMLKNGLSGAFLFFGDEDYMKAYCVSAARKAVCDDETFAFFNDMKIDAIDYSANALMSALMPLPMMADKKIVTVNGLNVSGLKPRELDELCDVLETLPEYDYNVLVISVPATMIDESGLPQRPSQIFKRLGEYLTFVQFDTVTGAKLNTWVGKHFAHNGVKATPDVCAFLIEYTGRSMYALANEIDKLSFYLLQNGRDTLTRKDVELVCPAEIATDAFALSNAILDGRGADAMNALSVMKFKRVDPIALMGEVSKIIGDLVVIKALLDDGYPIAVIAGIIGAKEYKVKLYAQSASGKTMQRLKEILTLCAQTDMSLKLSGQGYLPIERFICSI